MTAARLVHVSSMKTLAPGGDRTGVRFRRPPWRNDCPMRPLPSLETAVGKVERAESLDGSVAAVKKAVDASLPSPAVRDVLHGVPLGHALHPALVILPLGSWISASVLDFLPGGRRAAQALVGLGVLATVPTAAAGAADWSDLHPQQQRTGLVHAAGNVVALGLQAGLLAGPAARPAGPRHRAEPGRAVRRRRGRLPGRPPRVPAGGRGQPRRAGAAPAAGGVHPAVPRGTSCPTAGRCARCSTGCRSSCCAAADRVDVLFDECSHLSGPLSEGELTGDGDELCVTCPWHGSVFAVADGGVRRGPTTHPQPVLQVRVEPDGTVLVRLPEEG